MKNKGLEKNVKKYYESIRNLNHQIDTVYRNIDNDVKKSYIQKRINRVIENYKLINGRYRKIAGFGVDEFSKLESENLEIGKKVEELKYRFEKRKSNSFNNHEVNIKSAEIVPFSEKIERKNIYGEEKDIVSVYGNDGNIAFVYAEEGLTNYKKSQNKVINKEKGIMNQEILPKKQNLFNRISNSLKNISKRKVISRIAALGMSLSMMIPSVINVDKAEIKQNTKQNKNISHTNAIKDMPINEHQIIKHTNEKIKIEDKTKNMQTSVNKIKENSNKKTSKTKKSVIAPAQLKYTEVSDGSGDYGIFEKDTEVKIYNRALIKINKDGTKSILKATKPGQTWQEYAKEQGINYKQFKKYLNKNKNTIKEAVCTESKDGSLYGWTMVSELHYSTEQNSKNIEER